MKIIYKQGNLLDCTEQAVLHGCNAQGVMGSGVARAIREKYPEAYEIYMDFHNSGGLQLGCSYGGVMPDGKVVYSAITQQFYGRAWMRYVSYEAIRDVMEYMNWVLAKDGFKSVAMPKIGAGLGGGDWDVISKIIEEKFTCVQPVVYIL